MNSRIENAANEWNWPMTIKNVSLRFSLTYAPLLVLSGIAMDFFGLEEFGMEESAAISTFVLVGCVKWACSSFTGNNDRGLTKDEKVTIFWIFLLVALVLDIALMTIVLWQVPLSFNRSNLGVTGIFFIITFIVLVRAIPIYITVEVHKKSRSPNSNVNT
jgi:hypothetical protein